MTIYAGIDIGTGGVRGVCLSAELEVLFQSSRSYEVRSPESGWAEQDPDEIVAATLAVMNEVTEAHAEDEIVITLSSVMHSIIAVDSGGDPLSPMLIWADNRAIRETKWLEQEYGMDAFYRTTACPLHPSFWPGKVIWLGRELGVNRIARFVSIKEYLLHKLTGEWIVDTSVAGSSGLFDLAERRFDSDLLTKLGVAPDQFSTPVGTTHSTRVEIGGREIILVVGSTDGVLANLGIGALTPDTAVVTAGSSAAVRITSPTPVFDTAKRTWCYPLDEEHYVVGEAANSGGLVLNWLADLLGFDSAHQMTSEFLTTIPYEGVDALFLPTLAGERAPGYQEELRGEIIDLGLNATRRDIVIAAVEGVGLFTRFIYDDLCRAIDGVPDRTILTGGLGRSEPFEGLAPYLFGDCFERPEMDQSSAVGAAILGIRAHSGESFDTVLAPLSELRTLSGLSAKSESAGFRTYLDAKYHRFKEAYQVASGRIKAVPPLGPTGRE